MRFVIAWKSVCISYKRVQNNIFRCFSIINWTMYVRVCVFHFNQILWDISLNVWFAFAFECAWRNWYSPSAHQLKIWKNMWPLREWIFGLTFGNWPCKHFDVCVFHLPYLHDVISEIICWFSSVEFCIESIKNSTFSASNWAQR